jgi:hypothetical protein
MYHDGYRAVADGDADVTTDGAATAEPDGAFVGWLPLPPVPGAGWQPTTATSTAAVAIDVARPLICGSRLPASAPWWERIIHHACRCQ